jgi:hypothetical protein
LGQAGPVEWARRQYPAVAIDVGDVARPYGISLAALALLQDGPLEPHLPGVIPPSRVITGEPLDYPTGPDISLAVIHKLTPPRFAGPLRSLMNNCETDIRVKGVARQPF